MRTVDGADNASKITPATVGAATRATVIDDVPGAGVTYTGAWKHESGLQPAQAALIKTLKDNAEAMSDKVTRLETDLATQKDRRIQLERKVARFPYVPSNPRERDQRCFNSQNHYRDSPHPF